MFEKLLFDAVCGNNIGREWKREIRKESVPIQTRAAAMKVMGSVGGFCIQFAGKAKGSPDREEEKTQTVSLSKLGQGCHQLRGRRMQIKV